MPFVEAEEVLDLRPVLHLRGVGPAHPTPNRLSGYPDVAGEPGPEPDLVALSVEQSANLGFEHVGHNDADGIKSGLAA